jgi:hypothetical protein
VAWAEAPTSAPNASSTRRRSGCQPAYDECRDDGSILTGRSAEEIDDRNLPLHRIQEPAVIRRVRVSAHELVFDDIIARVDLAMGLALIIIPDPSASSWKHGLNAQPVCHLLRLENPAPWVDQRNALTVTFEPTREIGGIQNAALQSSKPVYVVESRLA